MYKFSDIYQWDLCEIRISMYVFSTFLAMQRVNSSSKNLSINNTKDIYYVNHTVCLL